MRAGVEQVSVVVTNDVETDVVGFDETLVDAIQADAYTDAQLDKVGALHDTFAYTSTMLVAMADHLARGAASLNKAGAVDNVVQTSLEAAQE